LLPSEISPPVRAAQYDRDIFGNLLSRKDSSNARWYFRHDGIGSTTALTDTSDAVAGPLLYDAWGNVRTSSGTSQGNYRFTGTRAPCSSTSSRRWSRRSPAPSEGSDESSAACVEKLLKLSPVWLLGGSTAEILRGAWVTWSLSAISIIVVLIWASKLPLRRPIDAGVNEARAK
jgi:hypothetical protein